MAWKNAGRINDKPAYTCLSTDVKQSGDNGSYLYEFNINTGELKVYRYESDEGWFESGDDIIGAVNISPGQTIGISSSVLPTGASTEATLLSIKSTDGIKKITDALPSGSNTIGNVGIVSATPLSVYSGVVTHTFHNAASATGDGVELNVESYKTLRIEITGTSSSRTVTFYGKHESGTLRAIVGFKEGDTSFTMATSTTGNNEVWVFDITAFKGIVMNLTDVSGGNVTVKGRAVT